MHFTSPIRSVDVAISPLSLLRNRKQLVRRRRRAGTKKKTWRVRHKNLAKLCKKL